MNVTFKKKKFKIHYAIKIKINIIIYKKNFGNFVKCS